VRQPTTTQTATEGRLLRLLAALQGEVKKADFAILTGEITGTQGPWAWEALRDLGLVTEQITGNLGLTMTLTVEGRKTLKKLEELPLPEDRAAADPA